MSARSNCRTKIKQLSRWVSVGLVIHRGRPRWPCCGKCLVGKCENSARFANGTTVNMLPMDALQTPQIVVPAKPVLAAFNDLAEAAHRRHEEMIDGSRTLAALRDALLPNLISGELWVRGAKRFIGRTT